MDRLPASITTSLSFQLFQDFQVYWTQRVIPKSTVFKNELTCIAEGLICFNICIILYKNLGVYTLIIPRYLIKQLVVKYA